MLPSNLIAFEIKQHQFEFYNFEANLFKFSFTSILHSINILNLEIGSLVKLKWKKKMDKRKRKLCVEVR